MYYLAYGMNTNRDAMAARCPNAKPMGGFYLPNHRLIFRGVADFRYDPDCVLRSSYLSYVPITHHGS